MADAELASALACLTAADMPEDVRAEFAGHRGVHHGAPMVTRELLE